MKKITLIFGVALLLGLFAFNNNANAQALVDHEATLYMNGWGEFLLPSVYNLRVETPSGNVTWNCEWQLTEGNPIIPENGNYKEDWEGWIGPIYYMGKVVINPNGKFKIVLHGSIE